MAATLLEAIRERWDVLGLRLTVGPLDDGTVSPSGGFRPPFCRVTRLARDDRGPMRRVGHRIERYRFAVFAAGSDEAARRLAIVESAFAHASMPFADGRLASFRPTGGSEVWEKIKGQFWLVGERYVINRYADFTAMVNYTRPAAPAPADSIVPDSGFGSGGYGSGGYGDDEPAAPDPRYGGGGYGDAGYGGVTPDDAGYGGTGYGD